MQHNTVFHYSEWKTILRKTLPHTTQMSSPDDWRQNVIIIKKQYMCNAIYWRPLIYGGGIGNL